jgi:c-di-GMP-specific phosphodiesterase
VFDAAVRVRAVARVAMEGALRRAVDEHSIGVHYQPIVDLGTRTWCGIEALARWHHPTLGEVPPSEFVALAEEIGVVSRLGHQILGEVINQIKIWDQAGVGIPVSVNVSAIQLTDPEMVDEILELVRSHRVRPDRINFEITESALMAKPELARRLLTRLRQEGIPAVIDDFGTGHSSIARLSELPTVGIKIDKTFTAALLTDPPAVTVVSAVIQLAHAFGLVVTAEGVESPVQLQTLYQLGCDQAQGYLIARPAPADALTQLLSRPPVVPLSG